MARGSVAISAKQGTGPSVTMSPGKGVKTSTFKPTVASSKSMKAPQAQASSQRGTTAPSVKQPAVSMVRDTKPRTSREQRVDAYNAMNKSTAGGPEYRTALEQEYTRIAGNKNPGTESTTIKRPKQAQ